MNLADYRQHILRMLHHEIDRRGDADLRDRALDFTLGSISEALMADCTAEVQPKGKAEMA